MTYYIPLIPSLTACHYLLHATHDHCEVDLPAMLRDFAEADDPYQAVANLLDMPRHLVKRVAWGQRNA